jgi:hypothetical protein
MLCGTTFRVPGDVSGDRFDELRELCAAAGDKASLAIGMAGLVMDHTQQDRMHEASELASEAMALIESIGDPALTVALSMSAVLAKLECAECCEALLWSQRAIDFADGDPSAGNLLIGSPLAIALAQRAIARYFLGRPGWRDDLRHGLAMARGADPATYAGFVTYAYFMAIPCGVLRPDDRAVPEIEDALRIAERSGDYFALALARVTLGIALLHRPLAAEREVGRKLMAEEREALLRRGSFLGDLPLFDICLARESARCGDLESAIPLIRAAVDHLFRDGQLLVWGIPGTGLLVETLLSRGADSDVAEAEAAIARLADAPADEGLVMRDIWLLRLRALLAQARDDGTANRDYRDRYREMAGTLGFEGHIVWAGSVGGSDDRSDPMP